MAAHPTPWIPVALCTLGWALLAGLALAVPWFVVFAVAIWISVPVISLAAAGLVALLPARRADAFAFARGVVTLSALAVLPSALVVWGAVAQMGDNYF